jgi:hypothetical protein
MRVACEISPPGMWKSAPASTTAMSMPLRAEIQTRFLSTNSTKNRVKTGRAETKVESSQCGNGV